MVKTEDPYRRTGRTTRMLRAAVAKALAGPQIVLVMGWDDRQINDLMKTTQQLSDIQWIPTIGVNYRRGEIHLGPGAAIKFKSVQTPDWDWLLRRLRGYDPTVPVFIDHHAHEKKARQIP